MRSFLLDLIRRAAGTAQLAESLRALQARFDNPGFDDKSLASDRDAILDRINYVNHNLYLHLREAMRVRELHYRDLMIAIDKMAGVYPQAVMSFEAQQPVAVDTDDHRIPWGAAQDNTRLPRFVAACERHFGRPLTFMDLGCSGGGLVLDFILRGHRAYGVEGSDHPQRALRAEWRVLRHNLFTADITRPFALRDAGGAVVACDVISAWEVMEHIAEPDLEQLFRNVTAQLKPDGLFIGSVATVPDDHSTTGARYHRTVQPRAWWERRFPALGMTMRNDHGFLFEDFCRGTGNGPIDEDYREHPEVGFHFVAGRA